MSTVFLLFSCSFKCFLTILFQQSQAKLHIFGIAEMGLGSLVLSWPSIVESGVCCGFMERKRFMFLLNPKVSSINVQSREKLSLTVLSILSLQEAVLMFTPVFSYLFLGLKMCFLIKSCILKHRESILCCASCTLLCSCLCLSHYMKFFWP